LILRTSARLLDRLTKEGSKLVFYDFAFTDTNANPGVDAALEKAVANHGSVILVGAGESQRVGSAVQQRIFAPFSALRKSALGWGHAELMGNVIRSISTDFAGNQYSGWIAASNAVPDRLKNENRNAMRWLNFYSAPGKDALKSVYFHDAIALGTNGLADGFFAGKYVFIGQDYPVKQLGSGKDTFATPHGLFGTPEIPGVAIHATAFLNLIRGDWLTMLPWGWQCVVATIYGILLSGMLFILSRSATWKLILGAALGATVLVFVSLEVQWRNHLWWGWLGPAFLQTAGVLVWAKAHPNRYRYHAFISYRPHPDLGNAELICGGLMAKGRSVFMDIKDRHHGPFPDRLRLGIEKAEFFLLIISTGSLAGCGNKDDWVLKEILHCAANRSIGRTHEVCQGHT